MASSQIKYLEFGVQHEETGFCLSFLMTLIDKRNWIVEFMLSMLEVRAQQFRYSAMDDKTQ